MVCGGFFARTAAYLLDWLIVGIALLITSLSATALFSDFLDGKAILFRYTLADILRYLAARAYFVVLTYAGGQTLGKKAMNLKVVNADGTEKLSLINVIYRETIGRFLSSILKIGYLMVGPDEEKRALHDRLCDTRVIYEKTIRIHEIRKTAESFSAVENDEMSVYRTEGYRYTEKGPAEKNPAEENPTEEYPAEEFQNAECPQCGISEYGMSEHRGISTISTR